MKKLVFFFFFSSLLIAHSYGQNLSNHIVVLRVGDGTNLLTKNANPVFIEVYSPNWTLKHVLPLPTAITGSNKMLTLTNNTHEGYISLTTDKLVVAGYNAAVGTLTPNANAAIDRTIGFVNERGGINTSMSISDAGATSIRSVISNGTGAWMFGSFVLRYAPQIGRAHV